MSNLITQTTQLMDSDNLNEYKNMAQLMCKSSVLPAHLHGNPANCLAIVFQSVKWNLSPFDVAQKTHFINGTMGYEAQLINAVVSRSTAIKGRFHYEFQGDRQAWRPKVEKVKRGNKDVWIPRFSESAAVRVGAILNGEEEVTWGEWVYPCDQQVFNSPLWRTNPKQQAGYLAVKFWARWYTPDIVLGAYTPDELHEKSIKDITPAKGEQKRSPIASMLTKQEEEVVEQDDEMLSDEMSEQEMAEAMALERELSTKEGK